MVQDVRFGDLGRIQWLPTLKLALARGVASALVLTIVMLAGGASSDGPVAVLGFFLMWSLTSFVVAPLMMLMIRGMNAVFAGMGLGIAVLAGNIMLFVVSLAVACGDPIVRLVIDRFPHLLEVTDFAWFNFRPAIFVLADDPGAGATVAKHEML